MWPLLLFLAGVPPPSESLDLGSGVALELRLVEHGAFQQGSPPGEAGRGDDETQRPVVISRDFYLGRTPVTRGQFARFVADAGYRSDAEKGASGGFGLDHGALLQRKEFNWRNPGFAQTDAHPVVLVTWDDAVAFTRWLSARSGRSVSLPSEAQWELAARGGSSARFPTGDSDAAGLAGGWFKAGSPGGTQPVAGKAPNAFGLFDMTGLVYQWCSDWYAPYEPGRAQDPLARAAIGSDKPRRVLRGGSFLKEPRAGRCAARYRNTPGSRNADNGFRVLADVAAAPPAAAVTTPAPVAAPVASAGDSDSGAALAMGILCLLAMGGSGVAFVWFLFRRPGRKRAALPGIATRPDSDGFWLDIPQEHAGATVNYACRVRGVEQLGSLTAEPGPQGQFVYTGGRPSDVRVTEILAAGAVGITAAAASASASRTRQQPVSLRSGDDDDDDRRFRGYPAAY